MDNRSMNAFDSRLQSSTYTHTQTPHFLAVLTLIVLLVLFIDRIQMFS